MTFTPIGGLNMIEEEGGGRKAELPFFGEDLLYGKLRQSVSSLAIFSVHKIICSTSLYFSLE